MAYLEQSVATEGEVDALLQLLEPSPTYSPVTPSVTEEPQQIESSSDSSESSSNTPQELVGLSPKEAFDAMLDNFESKSPVVTS
eukprot:5110933-Amphidinium_carterae.1